MPVAKFENYMQQKPEVAKRYLEIAKSEKLAEYNTLKTLVESSNYKQQIKDAARLKKLQTNSKVEKYLLAQTEEEKQKWEGRSEVMEFTSLKSSVVDYTKETARYAELQKDADILFYLAQDKAEMEKIAKLELIKVDQLDGNALKHGWAVGYLYPSKEMKAVHSYPNELQAYTGGKNIETIDGVLNMQVRKENATASVWDSKKGMITKAVEYTADILHNEEVAIEEGMLVQVKALTSGNVLHAINLQNAKHTQFVTILNKAGKQMKCGVAGNLKAIERILGLPYAVYGLYWGKKELIWYINDMEVCRMENTLKNEKMYLHMLQSVTETYKGTGTMKIDWVKTYKVKG